MDPPTQVRLSRPCAAISRVSLACCALLAGCHAGVYRPGTLPPQYSAPAPVSGAFTNLSQLARAPVDSQQIQPGDVLEVTLSTGLEEEKPQTHALRVDPGGMVNVPLVGGVPVGGLRFPDAEEQIRRASIERGLYRQPQISVLLKERQNNQVRVLGAVNTPGTFELPRTQSDLAAALAAAGGLSEDADTVVEIRRPGRTGDIALASHNSEESSGAVEQIDLAAPDARAQHYVGDGAVVMVMKQPERFVSVLGLVNKPGQFPMPHNQELRLLEALALAGGRQLEVADKVKVIRNLPGRSEPITIALSVRAAKLSAENNLRLAPGDVVSVEETPGTFVLGAVRNLVRFGVTATSTAF